MSIPVTVDSDDLEALLFATGAIKAVENALIQDKGDRIAVQAKGRLTAAHDRIANAWRESLRRAQFPERFAPATDRERDRLVALFRDGAGDPSGIEIAAPNEGRDLVERGFAEYGVFRLGVSWSSSGECTTHESPKRRLRLRQRGIEAIGGYIEIEPMKPTGIWAKLRALFPTLR